MNRIIHLTQMISLIGQRLDRQNLPDDLRLEILGELESYMFELESYVKDELYEYQETIDGQHPF